MTHQSFAYRAIAIVLGFLAWFTPVDTRAQSDPQFTRVNLVRDRPPNMPFIALSFGTTFHAKADPQILNVDSYRVTRLKRSEPTRDRFLGIERVTLDPDEEGPTTSIRLYLTTPLDVAEGDTIVVFYVADTFAGKELKGAVISTVTPISSEGSQGKPKANRPQKTDQFNFKKAKGRDDAHLYFAGELNRASGTSFSGNVDLKVELPLPALRKPRHELLPFFELKASNDSSADPDTINVGLESKLIVAQAGLEYLADSPVVGILSYNSFKLEGDRDFENVNAIFSSKWLFPLKPVFLSGIKGDRAFIDFTPFASLEAGKSLESPVDEAEGRGLIRVVVGSNVYARLFQGGESFARLTFDGVYERRWPLRAEVGFRDAIIEVENGRDVTIQVPEFFDSRPRQWAEGKLNYNFNEFFSVFGGYQYGELPPSYKLVDHSFRFGLVVKAKVK